MSGPQKSESGDNVALQRQGRWVGSQSGLARGITFDRATGRWGLNADAAAVREAFERVARGASVAETARWLGVAYPTMRQMLLNPIYCGRFVVKRRGQGSGPPNDPGQVEMGIRVFDEDKQLVPSRVWLQVQARIAERGQATRARRAEAAPVTWATGFLFSAYENRDGEADSSGRHHVVYGRHAGLRKGRGPRYLCRCISGSHNTPSLRCGLVGLRAESVNPAFDLYLTALTCGDWMRVAVERELALVVAQRPTAEREQVQRALARLERREREVRRAYEEVELTEAEFTDGCKVIRAERAALTQTLQALRSVDAIPTAAEVQKWAVESRFCADWPPEDKRAWLAQHLARIVVSNDGIETCALRVGPGERSLLVSGAPRRTWLELLGQAPRGLAAAAGAWGSVTTAEAAAALGIAGHLVRSYLQRGILPEPKQRRGAKRLWTRDEIVAAKVALDARTARKSQGERG